MGRGGLRKCTKRGWMGSGADKGTFKASVLGDNKLS